MLTMVRHAAPAIDPGTAPETWHLSPEGHAAATALATVLPAGAHLVSSPEPKALQTLAPGGAVTFDERFVEVWREGEPFGGNFRELRQAYVAGSDHSGWEPRASVAARFDAGVAAHLAIAGDRPLVIATHGMALTLWLTEAIGLSDPAAFWTDLRLPDAFAVDLAARTITRVPVA